MKNAVNTLKKFLTGAILTCGVFSAFIGFDNEEVSAADSNAILEKYETVADGELTAKVFQNATTELTQYYSIKLSTSTSLYGSMRYPWAKLIITDPSFDGTLVEFENADDMPTYTAEVYSITGSKSSADVIIPQTATYLSYFKMKVTSIGSKCITAASDIASITLPDSIESIKSDSFEGIADTTLINCIDSSKKSGWENGWNQNANVTYSYNLPADKRNAMYNASYPSVSDSNNGNRFFVGYYDNANPLPLLIVYDVKNSNGGLETRTTEFSLHSSNSNYDAVGNPIGQEKLDLSITISINSGESVVDDSLYLANIHKAKLDNGSYVPDRASSLKIKVSNSATRLYLKDFITIRPAGISSFGGYTELDILVDTVPGIYEKVKPAVYAQYESEIEKGTAVIRYRFTSLFESSYKITYTGDNGVVTKIVKINSPYTFYNLPGEKDNRVGFLIKNSDVGEDFSDEKIVSVDLVNFYVTVDVYSYSTKNIVSAQCSYNTKFGISNLYNANAQKVEGHDLAKALIIIAIASVCLYIVVAIILFVVLKNVFKNDEFRRLDSLKFLKKALIYFIGYAFIVLSATFIVFRWGFLYNSIVVYNPVDAIVIVTTLGALISLGLFIRDLVVAIQVSIKRNNAKKLKLNETVDDDGTM